MNCDVCRAISYNNTRDYNGILEKRYYRLFWPGFISLSVLATSIISALGLTIAGIAVGAIGFAGMATHESYTNESDDMSEGKACCIVIFLMIAAFSVASLIPIFTAKIAAVAAVIFTVVLIAASVFDNVNAVQYPEHNWLSVAIRTNRLWLVKLSLFLGADPNVIINKENQPLTALQWALSENRLAIAQTLLRYNANPNPPMIFAVNQSNLDLVRVLLGAGAHCSEENESNSPTARAIYLLNESSIKESNQEEKSEEYRRKKAVLEVLLSHQPIEARASLMQLYPDDNKTTVS